MVYLFQEPQGSADAFEALQEALAEWGPGLCFEDPVPYVVLNTREEAESLIRVAGEAWGVYAPDGPDPVDVENLMKWFEKEGEN